MHDSTETNEPSHSTTARSPRGSGRKPIAPRRRWFFRLLAIALSLVPFLLLELVLRVTGYGYDTRLIVRAPYAASDRPFQFNPPADRAYYGPEDLSGPEPRHFELPKPESVYRIVVVGGSTVAGFPYPFELALPRHLEVILEQQQLGTRFEVLNAGITSINSFSEVDIVRQVVASEPDLIVIHSGHNEFYGPGGSASNSSSLTPALYPVMQRVRRQRSFQLGLALIPRRRGTHLIETLPADIAIPLDGQVFRRTRARYQTNLERIVEIADRAAVPVVLSTVPSNLRDLEPLQPSSQLELTEQQMQDQAERLKAALRFISYGKYEDALTPLAAAHQVDPTNPTVVYRQAQCYEHLQRRDEAARAYVLASDLDGCRFRAPSEFARIVDQVAHGRRDDVYFCDVAAEFQSLSRYPAPGRDLFLEHVHYNLEGHWQAARILARCIVEDVLKARWDIERVPDDSRRNELLQVTPFDLLVADAQIIGILQVWPFSLSPQRDSEIELAKARWRSTYSALPKLEQELFTSQSLAAMTQNVLLVMGQSYLGAERADLALAAFRRHIARRPWDVAGYVGAVAALKAQGKSQEAEAVLDRARRIAPHDPRLQNRGTTGRE